MSVSRRVVLSVGLLVLLALGVLGYQLWTVYRLQGITNELSKISFVAASSLLKMELDADDLDVYFRRYLSYGKASRNDAPLDDRIQNIDQSFQELEQLRQPWEAPDEIAILSSAWIQYKAQIESVRQIAPEDGFDADEFPPSLEEAQKTYRSQIVTARDAVVASMGADVARNRTMGDQAVSVSIAAAAVFLVLSVAITFFTLRAINAPLRELTRGTRSIASGEFSHRIPVNGPSEFAELARDFNSMSEKLGELDQMKKDFVAHVSHELKAPLAAIRQTLAVTLEEVTGPINEAQRRLLQLSRNSAERLSAMVANLLDVSRLEAGTMEYEMATQDIVAIVRQVMEEFSLKAVEKQIHITLQTDTPAIPVVCDSDRMIQVIGNIVDNALKFSQQNSTIRIDVSHNHASSVPTATVSVWDRGNGVPDDHKQKVFQKFHQILGRGKRTAGQGVGLGLAICQTIMDAHRGRIWVEDNPEGGSVFRVEMRATQMTEAAKCG
ncbi:MAG TPA: HAMP domain-containing sensor histidine kinase [Terriglobia bacterium]|nr:HAMP domain-containing sensor histidine kinase [Terriglobia bacterium]